MKQTFDSNYLLRALLTLSLAAVAQTGCTPDTGPEPVEPLAAAGTDADAVTLGVAADEAAQASSGERVLLSVSDGWIRAAPPGAAMLAGYLSLENQGDHSRVLVGARSDAFGDVSIHRSVIEDGVSRMLPAGKLIVAAGESLQLEPGGLHLMLMAPSVDLNSVRSARVWLCFEDGDGIEEIAVDLRVGTGPPTAE